MRKTLFITSLLCLILICAIVIFRRNDISGEIFAEAHEEIIQEKDVTHYLDQKLGELLINHINSRNIYDLPFKKIITISFGYEFNKPYIYFMTSYLYRANALKNGYFELNDHLILLWGIENPYFEQFVKSENLEYGVPKGYLNETSEEYEDVVGYYSMFKRIWIGENGELIPE